MSGGHGAVHFLTLSVDNICTCGGQLNPVPDEHGIGWVCEDCHSVFDETLESEVDHPDSCKQEMVTSPDGKHCYWRWTCDVEYNLSELGLNDALFGIYDHEPLQPGFYLIRAWWSKTYYHQIGDEYDNGLEIVAGPSV